MKYFRTALVLLLLIRLPSLVQAQTHPCDASVPSTLTVTIATGAPPMTLGWCHSGVDNTGAAVTFSVYVDNTKAALTTVTKSPAPNAGGLYFYTVQTGTPVVGVHTYEMTATGVAGESARSTPPFVLTVNPAAVVPPSPVKVRVF